MLRVRPTENNFIEIHIDKPYEIHLVEFAPQEDFENFLQEEDGKMRETDVADTEMGNDKLLKDIWLMMKDEGKMINVK